MNSSQQAVTEITPEAIAPANEAPETSVAAPVIAVESAPAPSSVAKTPAKRAARRAPASVKPVDQAQATALPVVKVVAKAKPKAAPKAVTQSAVKAVGRAVVKPAAKPAAKVATKTAVKATAKAPTKAAPNVVTKKVAKPVAKVAVKPKVVKAVKVKKAKMVRDSFTIPKSEYDILASLKHRAGQLGSAVKKGELIRAGIKALAAMADAAYVAALKVVPIIKTGRPSKH